jgi:acyl-CoA synthetase (AMP-forming)/AMP-acid ligase II
VATESITTDTERTTRELIADMARKRGTTFLYGTIAFFAGSAVLTQSGQPGASTPVPWMLSHMLWIVATAFVATGTVRLVVAIPAVRTDIFGYVASGLVGLGVLHTLQWATWVYVDVIAYQQNAHEMLSLPLLHPFGTGHMLMFAIIIGSAIAPLAMSLAGTGLTHRALPWLGGLVGVMAALAGVVALVTFAPVRSPVSLVAIVSQALSFAWLFVVGVTLCRDSFESQPEDLP